VIDDFKEATRNCKKFKRSNAAQSRDKSTKANCVNASEKVMGLVYHWSHLSTNKKLTKVTIKNSKLCENNQPRMLVGLTKLRNKVNARSFVFGRSGNLVSIGRPCH